MGEFMDDDNLSYSEFFAGLNALAETAFPKRCATCGRVFETAEQFLSETNKIKDTISGLKSSEDIEGGQIVELFRNCPCGSTLMESFSDRRDVSEQGRNRRKRFDELMRYLVFHGFEKTVARSELLKVLRGEKSEVLANILPPPQASD
jgi:hypothetical protein